MSPERRKNRRAPTHIAMEGSRCGILTSASSLIPITGAVWSLDAKQQESRKRLGPPVRLRNEGRPQACRSRLEVTAELIEAPQNDAQPSSALMWQIGDRGAWEAGDAET